MTKRKQKALNAIVGPQTQASNCSLAPTSSGQTWAVSCQRNEQGSLRMPESGPGLSSERRCVDVTGKPPAERGRPLRTRSKWYKAGLPLDSELSLGIWKRASIFTAISFVKVGFTKEDENCPHYLLLVRNFTFRFPLLAGLETPNPSCSG